VPHWNPRTAARGEEIFCQTNVTPTPPVRSNATGAMPPTSRQENTPGGLHGGVGPRVKLDGHALSATAGPSHGAMALENITTALIEQKPMPPSQRRKCEDCMMIEPYFGFVGEKARWCGKCAKDHRGAIDVKHKQCQDCQGKRPHFGLAGAKVGLWCGRCAKSHEGSVPVGRVLCGDCGVKQPSFGLPGDGVIQWCSSCAKQREGTVDVVNNREYKHIRAMTRQRDMLAAELVRAKGQLVEKGAALRQAESTIVQHTFREEELQARITVYESCAKSRHKKHAMQLKIKMKAHREARPDRHCHSHASAHSLVISTGINTQSMVGPRWHNVHQAMKKRRPPGPGRGSKGAPRPNKRVAGGREKSWIV
jgi:hypothetical protein